MANDQNLVHVQPGQVLNPNGRPKGSKNLSTWIKDLLNDENFETPMLDSKQGVITYKGAPIKAIISVAIHRAIHDEKNGVKWAEWLGKYGYGIALKLEEDHKIEVMHIYKPEKLAPDDFNSQGDVLRKRAEAAVEAELGDLESATRPTDNGTPSARHS